MFDIVIRGGTLVDGSGAPPEQLDIGIEGDRVTAVGQLATAEAARVIDAAGRIVSPGFVDPHSHSDFTVLSNRDAHSTIRQGVTTEIVGNCGTTNAPLSDHSYDAIASQLRAYACPHGPTWRSFAQYLDTIEEGGTAQNLAFLVGHTTVRNAAGAGPEPARDETLDQMSRYVAEAMDAGALGMSTGLELGVGRYADTDEVLALAKVVGANGGYYASHVRNRDAQLLDSIDEFLRIVRASEAKGEISHLNVRENTGAPPQGWLRAVTMMEQARGAGVDVEADTTPFPQGLGQMCSLLPTWLVRDGYEIAAERLGDRTVRERVRDDCDRYWRFVAKGEWHRVRLQSSPQFPEWSGLRFTEIAELAHRDEWECYFDIMAAAGAGMVDLHMVGDLFTEQHLAEMISHPDFSLGVDAYTSDIGTPLADITRSPLPYRGHVEYLVHHVRERSTLRLEEAIHKMAGKPAQRFGLQDRGLLREGRYADAVVFDLAALASTSSFEAPGAYPEGIDTVIVNGRLVIDQGTHTGARAGRVLRR